MKIAVFSGSGISAESGIPTFRDNGGLWENYKVEQVATPAGYYADKEFVLDFYNEMRRKQFDCQPNAAHTALASLEKTHTVNIITQNIDNLHERAGSTHVLHLHGDIMKARSEKDPECIVDLDITNPDIHIGDLAPDGNQLRPHIVWFGESVPNMDEAYDIVSDADILIVVGTSLQVHPAAGIVYAAKPDAVIFVVDPNAGTDVVITDCIPQTCQVIYLRNTAADGIPEAIRMINRMVK